MTRRPVAKDRVHTSTLSVHVLDLDDSVWVILRGEADIATLGDLEAAVAHVELDDPRPVHLDVTELAFADVATIRHLAMFARRAARTGHRVRTYGSRPTLRKVATILGFHTDLGIL